MQLAIANPGRAMIALMAARGALQTQYNELANCRSCEQSRKDSMKSNVEFYNDLISQLAEQINANQTT